MKILKTSVPSDNGVIYSVDTIAHEGSLWLVPSWLEFTSHGWKKPRRMILLSALPRLVVQTCDGEDFIVLEAPISKAILNCSASPSNTEATIIYDYPDVRVPIDHKLNAI